MADGKVVKTLARISIYAQKLKVISRVSENQHKYRVC